MKTIEWLLLLLGGGAIAYLYFTQKKDAELEGKGKGYVETAIESPFGLGGLGIGQGLTPVTQRLAVSLYSPEVAYTPRGGGTYIVNVGETGGAKVIQSPAGGIVRKWIE